MAAESTSFAGYWREWTMQADLWTYAVDLYQRPGVAIECLTLQEHGANVCLVLCAAWLEQRAVPYTAERLAGLQAAAQDWSSEVVVGLRELRTRWRAPAQQDPALARLREAVKQLELQAEQVLLERLGNIAQAWPAGPGQARWIEAVLPATIAANNSALGRLRAACSIVF
jgi:uncharacterized protein (TIGR02444 family)